MSTNLSKLALGNLPPRYRALLAGDIDIQELDDEEISRQQLKASDGVFRGRPPIMLPPELRNAFKRELQRRMQAKFEELALEAVGAVATVMREGEGESETINEGGVTTTYKKGTGQTKAATYIIERVMGPIPKEVTVKTEQSPWELAADQGGLLVDVEADDIVVEAEVVQPRRRGRRTKGRHREGPAQPPAEEGDQAGV